MTDIITPSYVFDIDIFQSDIRRVRQIMQNVPLTFSMKANPVLANFVSDDIAHIEVCSPGEFEICKKFGISGKRIIYSGVLKREEEIREALDYKVDIITAESDTQFELIKKCAEEKGISSKVILRLTSGNQFGISRDHLVSLIEKNQGDECVDIIGLHYYSGTQKKRDDQIKKDLELLNDTYLFLKNEKDYKCRLVEYGPGLAVDYFEQDIYAKMGERVHGLVEMIGQYEVSEVIGLEFGRILASSCGSYRTKVCDIKDNNGVCYVITDGGIHQLRYYGQNMAMQIPPMKVEGQKYDYEDMKDYCICGSLCTVSDVLVRNCKLPKLKSGDIITFGWCGAYSSTEASSLFLSRELPVIYLKKDNNVEIYREMVQTCNINIANWQY